MRIWILLVLLMICGCSYTGHIVKDTLPTENGSIEVYFCPRDNCSDVLFQNLNSAEDIKCAFFDLGLPNIIDILKQKQAKLVTDEDNPNKALMHNKFCILDNTKIITGSMNPTENGATKNNNNLVIIESKYLVQNYNQEFEELEKGKFGIGGKVKHNKIIFNGFEIENYFCPEDDCEEKVLNTLMQANESIYFMTFSFTSDPIGEFLLEKNNELEIKGIFESFQNSKWSEYRKMQDMNVILDKNSNMMHHKVFIIDNKTTILGSYNPTKNANENNDENILIIHDEEITKKFIIEFNLLYNEN